MIILFRLTSRFLSVDYMYRLLGITSFALIGLCSRAQQIGVSGKCTDLRGVPVDGVKIYAEHALQEVIFTDDLGRFELFYDTSGNFSVLFRISGTDLEEIRSFKISGEDIDLGQIRFNFQQSDSVKVTAEKKDPFAIPTLPLIDIGKLPMNSVEKMIVYSTAAVSNNELTTNYNVRGGSYDENLVYVNGFNVYRPFLTRAGQQEGMSFIHTSLVESIKFSGGGFESEYGDKLSSVLDIQYRKPSSTKGSGMISLLGVESHVEGTAGSRFNYIAGSRYRSNGYLLNSLPTKGAYNPVFWDAQLLTDFALTENLTWSVLGHYSSNNFRFIPETQETDFGTANEAYSFRIYFEGQEVTRFTTMMGGTSLKWKVNPSTNLDFYATVFNTDEREYFDILGQYFINELETDPSKEEFGDSIAVLGIGSFMNHARNRLNATIINLYHHGSSVLKVGFKDDERLNFREHRLKWGVNFQMDEFSDVLSEWKMIDSAGYSQPQEPSDKIQLFETIKGKLDLSSQRYTSFLQYNAQWSKNKKDLPVSIRKKLKGEDGKKYFRDYSDTIRESAARFALSLGTRGGYTSANNEFFLTPRATVSYFPRAYMVRNDRIVRRDLVMRLSTGLYYQPPFYREFRTFDGELNLDVLAQKSLHVVAGSDVFFDMWQREVPFKFTAEAYYKYMWDINTYEIENVRTRYYANNDAVAYAYGLDMNVHGQFVEGIESFFKVGFMSTKEDVLNDQYTVFYNEAGERIIFGFSEDQTVVDSAVVFPGYVPRPTDQWLTFGALVQDRMPVYERFSVQMGMLYGSRLPYGPPDFNRYKDTLRLKSYFRVDIGLSYDFLYGDKEAESFWTKNFTEAILSFEVFNLLGVNNVMSKQWVQDVSGKYYSVPNYLTQRRFNLKLILRF